MQQASGAQIPVETILKMVLDRSSAEDVQRFMEGHEKSWSNIDKYVKSVGENVESFARMGMGLAGVAGVGAVANNFFNTSQLGSNVGLAAGNVTGGSGVWHPYAQSMLSAQARTGVAASEIAQGLIQAVQAVGGNPTPNQAAILGGLLAGYGQTVGMTPAQVSQVISPLLQAANKPLTSSNILSTAAGLSGTLTAFPGSQAAPMLGMISNVASSQALGSGPSGGFSMSAPGVAATVNAAAQTNKIWRQPGLTGSAINGISGGMQNAYQNPSQEAFFQMAGVSYQEQREGFTPQSMQKIMSTATKLYGTGPTRDIFLRSMFGMDSADLMEQFAPGSKGASNLKNDLSHHASTSQLQNQINHPQARTTPNALLNRAGGGLLGWIEQNPLTGAAGLLGALKGPGLVSKAPGALSKLLGGGSETEALGADAGAGGLSDALGLLLGRAAIPLALLGPEISPDSISTSHLTGNQTQQTGVKRVLQEAQKRFGKNYKSPQARNWMQAQLYDDPNAYGAAVEQSGSFNIDKYRGGAGKLLDQMLGDQYGTSRTAGGQDPVDTFSQAATKLLQFANKLTTAGFSSYHPGASSSQDVSLLGTGGIQALGAMAPGMEFAALTGGGGGSPSLVSLGLGSGGGGAPSNTSPTAGGGWQPCILTWYNPALGGINSGNGAANPNAPTASGQPYSASAYTCAAPPNYAFGTQIDFSYGGKTLTCTVNDRGGAIQGNHFDLSQGAAEAIGLKQSQPAGGGHGKFRVVSTGNTSSSSSGGGAAGGSASGATGGSTPGGAGGVVSDFATAAGTGMTPSSSSGAVGGVGQPIHINFNVDGHRVKTARILRGHKT